MAVAVDATGTADLTQFPGSSTGVTFNNLTIGAGLTNSALLAIVITGNVGSAPTGLACTWNGVSMNLITSTTVADTTAGLYISLFGLNNPASGNQALAVSWGGGTFAYSINAMSFSGVDQGTPFSNGITATGTAGNPSITITSAVGDYTLAAFGTANVGSTTAGGTQLFHDTGASYPVGSAVYATGAATVNFTENTSSGRWVSSGVDVKANVPLIQGFPLNSDPPVFKPYINQDKHGKLTTDAIIPRKRVFLTSGTTWVIPPDYNSFNNQIECIAGGAGGDNVGGGGGAGAYSSIFNLALFPGATAAIQVGAAGTAGNPGTDTWLNSTSTVLAKGGSAPITTTGGVGGLSANGVGTTKFGGGNGGSVASANPGGGGGAAGPKGKGNDGAGGGVSLGGSGGSADTGFGGAGGVGTASGTNPGAAGTEYDATHGAGGGGGGSVSSTAGAGGNYGGGGGGSLVTGGAGAPGLIIITYSPATVAPLGGWSLNSDPPSPPGFLSQSKQSDLSMKFLSPATAPTLVSGMAWWRPFETPKVVGTSVNVDKYTDSTQPITFVLAKISGMAWYQAFNQPKFSQLDVNKATRPTEFGVSVQPTLVSGQAWLREFDQPRVLTGPKYWEHQTEMMAPPLPTVFVMAGTSEDQPLVLTNSKAWLSPQSTLTHTTVASSVGISGMAWYQNFNQPKFSQLFQDTPNVFGSQPTAPLVISGMAWFREFDQPKITTLYKPWEHPDIAWGLPGTPAVGPSGLPWWQAFSQPAFTTLFKIYEQAAESYDPSTSVLPAQITGVSWSTPFDQPFFNTGPKYWLHQTELFSPPLALLPRLAAGSDEQPQISTWANRAFAAPQPVWTFSPLVLVVGVAGQAWYQNFDQPRFSTTFNSTEQPGYFDTLTPGVLPAGISGMAWYQSFLQPRFATSINPAVQSYTMPFMFPLPPVFAVGTTIAGSGPGHPRSNRSVRSGRSNR